MVPRSMTIREEVHTTMASSATVSNRKTMRLLQAAEGYLALDMFEHALRDLRGIADPSPARLSYHLLKAEAHRGLKQWSDALQEFQICHAERPEDLDVLMGLAWCYKRTDQLSQSIATMLDAYRAHPKTPVVLYNLACYYALARQKTQAVSWLARALRMDSDLRQLIPRESDFDPIRQEPEFQRLLELTD